MEKPQSTPIGFWRPDYTPKWSRTWIVGVCSRSFQVWTGPRGCKHFLAGAWTSTLSPLGHRLSSRSRLNLRHVEPLGPSQICGHGKCGLALTQDLLTVRWKCSPPCHPKIRSIIIMYSFIMRKNVAQNIDVKYEKCYWLLDMSVNSIFLNYFF